ncbi:MAG: hypothetical protein CM15mV20_0920 [uncultured marine virus]|nr:MAG: hypothetical protein CM15mV20_0920 [uncultured marine virus]
MSKFDAINDSLDIEVVDEEESSITKKESKAVEKDKKDSVRDYEYTRGNLYSLIEKGQEALDSIMEVAQEGQQPRAFEVVSQLIKNVADTTDKLVDLQQKMKNLEAEDPKGPSTVNNALFVGSTAELQKLLKNQSGTKKTK